MGWHTSTFTTFSSSGGRPRCFCIAAHHGGKGTSRSRLCRLLQHSPNPSRIKKGHAGLDAIEGLTRAKRDRALPLEADVALHYGDVVYGNIESETRLDFTVIGAAVNEATRIEALCQTLGRPLLISAEFAKVCTCHPRACFVPLATAGMSPRAMPISFSMRSSRVIRLRYMTRL